MHWMVKVKVASLFSGGKDSTYALHWAFIKGLKVKCLVTVKPRKQDSWMFHVPCIELTTLQAKALGLPHIYVESSGEKGAELSDLYQALRASVKRYGVEGVVVGGLLSDYQRLNVNMICERLNLSVFAPFWRKNHEEYMREIVDLGFKVMVTAIDVYGLPSYLVGKVLTKKDVEEIIQRARKYGFNPAFEGGEAETLVLDAPLFKKALEVKGKVVKCGEYSWRYVITEAKLVDK